MPDTEQLQELSEALERSVSLHDELEDGETMTQR